MARHQLKLDWYKPRPAPRLTHEQFVHEVAKLGLSMLKDADERARVAGIKLTYGAGHGLGARGITFFDRWLNDKGEQAHFVEICAHGEHNPVQLAGTTLHELGHVVAGPVGHGKEWHQACERLGLRAIRAAGTEYKLSMIHPAIRADVMKLIERLNDGRPNNGIYGSVGVKMRPCSAGVGVKGGKSRGVGSGSRLRKYVCSCGQIIRAGTDELDATHNECGTLFEMVK